MSFHVESVGSPAVLLYKSISNLPPRSSILCSFIHLGGIIMSKVTDKLTVFFEEPFWVGVFERIDKGKLSVSKVTFGAEPKDFEVYDFILKHYYQLPFSPTVEITMKKTKKNPKRIQREVHKQMSNTGIGTKSQQALAMQREANKEERKAVSKEKRQAEKERQFELKKQKKKEKHRGK